MSRSATEVARENWDRNRARLPEVVAAAEAPKVEWLYGRDGSLTGRTADGWLGGSSVPGRAAAAVLERADLSRRSLCVVAPNHARHVRYLLDRTPASAALLAAWPDAGAARLALACDDFADDLDAGRLLVAAGADLAGQIRRLAEDRPGWAVPETLLKPGDAAAVGGREAVEMAFAACRSALASAAAWRRERVTATVRDSVPGGRGHTLVIAPSTFALWRDAGDALWRQFERAEGAVRFDPDSPRSASSLALAQAAAGAGRVVAADVFRGDVGGAVAAGVAWRTWVTRRRAGVAVPAGDEVAVVDARWAGDFDGRATVARWPVDSVDRRDKGKGLLVALDLPGRELPGALKGYSSQAVLWERIAAEVEASPGVVEGAPAADFVRRRALEAGVPVADPSAWGEHCVTPAYARGVVRALRSAGERVRVAGAGWGEGHGPVRSRAELRRLARGCRGVVDPVPGGCVAVGSLGVPVVQGGGPARRAA